MNKPLFAAASLSFITFGVHVFLGGPEIHEPLLASNAPDLVRSVGSVVWHAVSALLLLNSLALLYASKKPSLAKPLVILVVTQYLAFVALFTGYGLARFGSLTIMPLWTGFLVMSALALWGIDAFNGSKQRAAS
jgi:hypothetical protein